MDQRINSVMKYAKRFLKRHVLLTCAATCSLALLVSVNTTQASEHLDLNKLSLESLFNLKITTASGVEETLSDSPAATVVITEKDFKERGYNSLLDILVDLPGFDVIESGAASPVTFYQRGYRTPFSSRTLFMINGVIDNHLWSQEATMSKQYPVSNIKRVEVLYGPTSVLYGPNAFLGIINVITKNAEDLSPDEHKFKLRGELGSWDSQGSEITARGKLDTLEYNLSARVFKSDEEDLSDRWGFLSNDIYSDPNIWGPILDLSNNGEDYGHYYDPTDDWGILGDMVYKQWKAGIIYWKIDEGYGANFTADHGQNNGNWSKESKQHYIEYEWQASDQLRINNFALYRESNIGGDWAEAEPDWRDNMQDYAFISETEWNSTSKASEFKQDLEFDLSSQLKVIGGWRYKRSDVTKAYDIPGYWGAYSSSTPVEDLGPHGQGAGIFHSTDPIYHFSDKPLDEVPSDNRQTYNDKGVYIGGIYNVDAWRFNTGLRYDKNSIWGSSSSPRISAIRKFNNGTTVIKTIYGEGYQEPPAQQLYGGWNGRQSNPDLLPEDAKNLEFVLMHKRKNWLHETAVYTSRYENVIRESALNDAERNIWGLEYKCRFEYTNFLIGESPINGTLYYSYIQAKTNRTYDHALDEWVNKDTDLGDIAPHKINAAMNLPFAGRWNLNLKGNFLSRTALYSRNPLSAQGVEVASRAIFDSALSYHHGKFEGNFKVENFFDREVFAPGLRTADSGNDFTQRSQGYSNSLTPLPGRSFWLTLSYELL